MPFSAKLLFISPWLFLFTINIFFIIVSLILLFLVRQFIPYHVRQSHNGLISDVSGKAVAMFGVLLVFTLIGLWQQYHHAVDNAVKEGNAAFDLYRDICLYPDTFQIQPVFDSHLHFIDSVIHDEYPAMHQMKRVQKTQRAMDNLWANIVKIQPKTQQEQALYSMMLADLKNLSQLRDIRLFDMQSSLPRIFWVVIIIGAVVSISFAIFLGVEKSWIHAVVTSMLAVSLATTIFLIIEMDYPFLGELSAWPSSYVNILTCPPFAK